MGKQNSVDELVKDSLECGGSPGHHEQIRHTELPKIVDSFIAKYSSKSASPGNIRKLFLESIGAIFYTRTINVHMYTTIYVQLCIATPQKKEPHFQDGS